MAARARGAGDGVVADDDGGGWSRLQRQRQVHATNRGITTGVWHSHPLAESPRTMWTGTLEWYLSTHPWHCGDVFVTLHVLQT